jgi:hypothetical protein
MIISWFLEWNRGKPSLSKNMTPHYLKEKTTNWQTKNPETLRIKSNTKFIVISDGQRGLFSRPLRLRTRDGLLKHVFTHVCACINLMPICEKS